MSPPPTPTSPETKSASSTPTAAPRRCSARIPASASLAIAIGTATASARASRAPSGTSTQPRFGAIETTPSSRRTTPATATPMPMIGPSCAGAQLAREVAQVGDDVVDRELPARPVDADLVEGPAAQPDDRGGDRVDQDLEAQDDGSGRDEPDERRWPARRPETDGVVLGDEPGVGELTDQRADRTPGQAGGGDELGARLRPQLMEAADDGAEVGAMDRLAALARRRRG